MSDTPIVGKPWRRYCRISICVHSTAGFRTGYGLSIGGHKWVVVEVVSATEMTVRPFTWRDAIGGWWSRTRRRVSRAWWRIWDALTGGS